MPAVHAIWRASEAGMLLVVYAGTQGDLVEHSGHVLGRGLGGQESTVNIVELRFRDRHRCERHQGVWLPQVVVLHYRLVNLVDKEIFVRGIGSSRVKVLRLFMEGIVINVSSHLACTVRIIGTRTEQQ